MYLYFTQTQKQQKNFHPPTLISLWAKYIRFLKKNQCPISGIRRWGKNHMRCRTIFPSYCRYYRRYYSHHTIVVTIVVTTVAMENRMTTHAIVILIYGCSMSCTIFKKKLSFKDNDDDAKICTVLPGAKEQRAKNDDECSFFACGIPSLRRNHSKLRVSRAVGAPVDDGSGEMRM